MQGCLPPLINSTTGHYNSTGTHSTSLWSAFLTSVQHGRALEHTLVALNGMGTHYHTYRKNTRSLRNTDASIIRTHSGGSNCLPALAACLPISAMCHLPASAIYHLPVSATCSCLLLTSAACHLPVPAACHLPVPAACHLVALAACLPISPLPLATYLPLPLATCLPLAHATGPSQLYGICPWFISS